MLVVTRKRGQSIVFFTRDGEITVKYDRTHNGARSLIVDAPQSVKVLRAELVPPKHNESGTDVP